MCMRGKYCVYVHTNKTNGKMYVGQTSQEPNKRWKSGFGYLNKNKSGKYAQPLFAEAIKKYGWDGFYHEIIASNLTQEEANNFEKLLIEKLDTTNKEYGYNILIGGDNCPNQENNKIKVAQYDTQGVFVCTWDCITDASNKLNINRSDISSCCKHKLKSAGGFVWRYVDEGYKSKIKSIYKKIEQYDKQGNLIKTYSCIKQAEDELHIDGSSISKCCKGKRKTAGGFIWRYT